MGRVIKFFEDVGRLTIKLSETISTKHGIATMKKELLREYSRIRDLGNTTCV
jgi:D-lactate dehydrogenase (cytochrome)/glycolate oxidase